MTRRNGSSDIGLVASSFACALVLAPQPPEAEAVTAVAFAEWDPQPEAEAVTAFVA